MLLPASLTESQVTQGSPDTGYGHAKAVFRVLHASFGNLFMTRFQTGALNAKGRDMGTISAMKAWGASLARFSEEVVIEALERSTTVHVDYPPTLPQFLALCRACSPAKPYRPPVAALPMDAKLRSVYAAQAREINRRHAGRKAPVTTALPVAPEGLGDLFAAIADAAACAGADEAFMLRRLETSFQSAAAR